MAYSALCENLRCWHFLRPRCCWRLRDKVAVRRLPLASQVVRGQEDRPAVAEEWGAGPHRAEWLARGAISFLTQEVDAPAIHRATGAFARMAFVAPRNSHAETFVVIQDKCVLFKNVSHPVQRVPIRMNARLPNIVNIRSVNRALWGTPMRDVWAARKCRRENVCPGLRPARRECLRRNPTIRSHAWKLVSTNHLRQRLRHN